MIRPHPIAAAALLLLVMAGGAHAQSRHYLSQIANGGFAGGSFRTTFILFNNTDADLTASLKLTGDNGSPLTVTIPGLGTRSEFSIFIPAGATQILQTDGSGTLVAGAATVAVPAKIGVSAIFTIYDENGGFVTEAGVGSSEPLTEFVLPVDTTGLFNTGLALFNAGAASAAITVVLRDTSGRIINQATLSLGVGAHLARFVAGTNQLFPSAGNLQGSLLVRCSTPVAALGLRQNQVPLSYTSLPVVPSASTRLTQNLAQVVNGSFDGGSFRTSFLIFNLSPGAADVSLSLTRDNGSPFSVTIPGSGTRSTFNFSLAAGASAFLPTDGSGPLTAGAATITSTAPLGASAIFTVFDGKGAFQTEAGVGDSPAMTAMTLPVDIAGQFNTGVAFFNPGSAATTVTLKLLNANGELYDPGTAIDLGSKNHTAQFISEIFPGAVNFQGSLTISAPSGVAALTLRQYSSPLSYTTLPVVSGFATAKAPDAPLLSRTQTGLALTGSTTINESLPAGFRLTGQLLGKGRGIAVIARRADGAVYAGELDSDTNSYLIALGQGTYTLQVCYLTIDVGGRGGITLTYADPSPVQVAGDLARHITLPSPSLFGVSGRVSGLATLPEIADASVIFTSSDQTIEGRFALMADGSYSGSLPNGTYRASVSVPLINFTPVQNQSLAIYNIGAATVNGGPITADLAIPATARISGSVRSRWLGSPAFGIRVSASDRSAPAPADSACILPPSFSGANTDGANQYQMALARSRSYDLSVAVPLWEGSRRLGIVNYPLAADPVNLAADTSYNFNLPDLPGQVTVAGRVTDGQGRGLAGVSVVAFSQTLTGVANLSFAGTALTDDQGGYSMTVLSGTQYQLRFIPPAPAPPGQDGIIQPVDMPRHEPLARAFPWELQ